MTNKYDEAKKLIKPKIKTMDDWIDYVWSKGFKVMPLVEGDYNMGQMPVLYVPQHLIDLMPRSKPPKGD
jgi:hypothetical protein